ncbi:MAG TPA: divalent-cation tolerance protein CutA [bacterium]|nr:divalent-cation tolerance protein CutA [bacterium]
MSEPIVCFSTASSAEEAEKIARGLVESQLAACVNILPQVRSIYRWEGKIEDGAEWLLVIKSRRHLLDDLVARVRGLHSYSVPEVVALPILGGNPDYLAWLNDSTWGPR